MIKYKEFTSGAFISRTLGVAPSGDTHVLNRNWSFPGYQYCQLLGMSMIPSVYYNVGAVTYYLTFGAGQPAVTTRTTMFNGIGMLYSPVSGGGQIEYQSLHAIISGGSGTSSADYQTHIPLNVLVTFPYPLNLRNPSVGWDIRTLFYIPGIADVAGITDLTYSCEVKLFLRLAKL